MMNPAIAKLSMVKAVIVVIPWSRDASALVFSYFNKGMTITLDIL